MQRIVAIDRQPSHELHPDFLKLPIFCVRQIENQNAYKQYGVRRESDGWAIAFMNDSSKYINLEFRADRHNHARYTGTIERAANDSSDVNETIPIRLPNPHGNTGNYWAGLQDVELCVWVEYLPALIDDGFGNMIEAPRSKINNFYSLSYADFEQPTYNSRDGVLTIKMRANRVSRKDYSLPEIRGVRIHYAMQAGFIANLITRSNQDSIMAQFVNTDIGSFELQHKPPSDVLANGLPRFEHAGTHGFVATSRTTDNLIRSTIYKGYAARAIYQFDDNPTTTVGTILQSHRTMHLNNFNVCPVQATRNQRYYSTPMFMASTSTFGNGTGLMEVMTQNQNLATQNVPGYTLDKTKVSRSYIYAVNFAFDNGDVGFTGLPDAEKANTYKFSPLVDSGSEYFSYNRISGDTTYQIQGKPTASIAVDISGGKKQFVIRGNSQTLLTMDFEDVDTLESKAVTAKDFRVRLFNGGFGGADHHMSYNERTIGSLEFAAANLTIDTSNNANPYDSGKAFAGFGYRYVEGAGVGAPTPPPVPVVESYDGVIHPSWQVLF
ncbi:VHS1049 protein [Vibrio phage 1]|nr:VHS1049 protein [Vibrio phage 1]